MIVFFSLQEIDSGDDEAPAKRKPSANKPVHQPSTGPVAHIDKPADRADNKPPTKAVAESNTQKTVKFGGEISSAQDTQGTCATKKKLRVYLTTFC